MDLIDRQAIHDKVTARYPDSDATQYSIGYADAINDVLKDIRYMQSAQKTGKWTKETRHFIDQFQEFDYYTIKCSVCGSAPEKNWHLTHYCPNCGSRMLEEWEEE